VGYCLERKKRKSPYYHPALAEWKSAPNVLEDITNVAVRNIHILTQRTYKKELAWTLDVSMAAANIEPVRAVVKKGRKQADKMDNERVNPFEIIALLFL